jgi:SHS2 domain-containing protein
MRSSATVTPRWHRFIEHTGELQLRIRGESLAGLMAEAAHALGLLLLGSSRPEARTPPRIVEIESHDRESLLVDWLNELLYLAETELWAPTEARVLEIAPTRLRAAVTGAPLEAARSIVKAATLHGVRIGPQGGGLQAEVVLDV